MIHLLASTSGHKPKDESFLPLESNRGPHSGAVGLPLDFATDASLLIATGR